MIKLFVSNLTFLLSVFFGPVPKGSSVYVENSNNVAQGSIDYFKLKLCKWNYWRVVNKKEDADYIIEFHHDGSKLGARSAKIFIKDKKGVTLSESEKYTAHPSTINANTSKVVIDRVIKKYFKADFQ